MGRLHLPDALSLVVLYAATDIPRYSSESPSPS